MKPTNRPRIFIAFAMMFCLLLSPLYVYAKKGEKNFNQGMKYELEMKWDLAAQEFALALAQNPSDSEYRLHYQRAMFNSSQMFMTQGRALEEKGDYVGAYNAFRQAYAYDPVNELALAEMDRMKRLQQDKIDGKIKDDKSKQDAKIVRTSLNERSTPQQDKTQYGSITTEQRRVVNYNGDLKAFIKEYAKYLNLNVIFDANSQQFRQGGNKNIEINLRDVTAAEALDYVFLQEGLFFQKIGRRTVIVADQQRRPFYQQLVIRTFYLANAKPDDVRTMLQSIIPPQAGRINTGVVVDKETNSITLRDTRENVRLMAELIQNIDKDRPEVVMDVNIYEVSKDKLFQLGNQFGTEDTLKSLGGAYLGAATGDRSAIEKLFGAGLGPSVGLVLPPSTFSALERKNDAKLLVSTQVHAFNNEESSARIGQRVPVQTAQVYPYTNTNINTPNQNNNPFGGGGFPVINYEPTGLTLKFKPIIFPNKDVQVTMSIESKDVFNADSPTPTFIERTIAGTARIQNNRTMMLASVAQDRKSNSRSGIPLLGLIPILGRLFSTPSVGNTKTDIVIAVTPRVLRAPDITPRDEDEYESGSMQNPTTVSIAKMIAEEDQEENLALQRAAEQKQIEQARNVPQNVEVEYKPEQTQAQPQVQPQTNTQTQAKTEPQDEAPTYVQSSGQPVNSNVAANTTPNTETQKSATNTETVKASDKSGINPMPIDADKATKDIQVKKTSENLETSNALKDVLPKPVTEVLAASNDASIVSKDNPVADAISKYAKAKGKDTSMSLVVDTQLTQDNKRRIAVLIDARTQLNSASISLRFDPAKVKINGVTAGNILTNTKSEVQLTPLITPDGLLALTINMPAGSVIKGTGVLVYLDIEMLQNVAAPIVFDYNNVRLTDTNKRSIFVEQLLDTVVK